MKKLSIALVFLVPCLPQQTRINFSGVITGNLTGDDGTSIVGGYLSLHLLPPSPKNRQPTTEWNAVSGADGSFRFDGLNDGTYRLCAQVPNTAWLNPCEWGLQPPLVTLSTGRPNVSVPMVVKKGAEVSIRIVDPGQFLSLNEGRTPGAHLLVGVANDAFVFRPAAILPPGTNGANRQIVIPFNSPRKLVVHSSFFQLSDANGIPLSRTGTTIPVLVPLGTPPAIINLIVTGGSRQLDWPSQPC